MKTEQKPIDSSKDVVQTIKQMRLISNSTGLVYDAQVEQLKKLAAVFFVEPHVATVSIDMTNRLVKVESTGPSDGVTERFPEAIQYILGETWKVQTHYDIRPAKTGRAKHSVKPPRKKRSGKLRRK